MGAWGKVDAKNVTICPPFNASMTFVCWFCVCPGWACLFSSSSLYSSHFGVGLDGRVFLVTIGPWSSVNIIAHPFFGEQNPCAATLEHIQNNAWSTRQGARMQDNHMTAHSLTNTHILTHTRAFPAAL